MILPVWVKPLAIGVGLLGLFASGVYGGIRWSDNKWNALIAEQKIDAAQQLNASIKRNAAADALAAELAIKLDAQHAQHLQDLELTRADYRKQLADGVRDARRGFRCDAAPAAKAPNPSGVENAAARSERELQERIAGRFERVSESAGKLAEWVKVCHAWANSPEVGRH